MRQLCSCHFCTELKTKPSQRWDELWVMGAAAGSVHKQAPSGRLILAGGSPAVTLILQIVLCARLLPQIEASYHLLVVHTTHLPVPKYFKLLKEKFCFIHQIFYDNPRPFFEKNAYRQMRSVTFAAVRGALFVYSLLWNITLFIALPIWSSED